MNRQRQFRKLAILSPGIAARMATALLGLASLSGIRAHAQALITDPASDAIAYGSFTLPIQDVVSVGGSYDESYAYLSAGFRPNSFSTANLGFVFYLDTDQNPATGAQFASIRGFDYWIFFSTEL